MLFSGNLKMSGAASEAELPNSGNVYSLYHDLVLRLPHGRLVVLGERGAGASVALIQALLCGLTEQARDPQLPLPVWISLRDWEYGSASVRDYVIGAVHEVVVSALGRQRRSTTEKLFSDGHIALMIDDLAYLAPASQKRVLHELDHEFVDIRMMMVCHPEEYREAIEGSTFRNAAVIELAAVDPACAEEFLVAGSLEPARAAWRALTQQLRDDACGGLAVALRKPSALALVRQAGRSGGADLIRELSKPALAPAATVRASESLVDAVGRGDRLVGARRASADQLYWLARYFRNGQITWWQLPEHQSPALLRLAAGLFVAVPIASVWVISAIPHVGAGRALSYGVMVGVACGLVAACTLRIRSTPRIVRARFPSTREVGPLIAAACSAAAICLMLSLTVTTLLGLLAPSAPTGSPLPLWLMASASGAAFAILSFWGWREPGQGASIAYSTWALDRNSARLSGSLVAIVALTAYALGAGIAYGFSTITEQYLSSWSGLTRTWGAPFGLSVAILVWFFSGRSPLVRVCHLLMAIQGGPWKLQAVLEDAADSGLLWRMGDRFVIRHREVLEYLASDRRQN
jgi:hypothetical protein